jgi:TATA-box binding protein (TBP) (component of TFIID and TFIIIB)
MSAVVVRTPAASTLSAALAQSHAYVSAAVPTVTEWVERRRHELEHLPPPQVLPVNTVVKAHVRTVFNMRRACHELADLGAKFNRCRFAAIVFRLEAHKATLMLFSRGRIVCTGVRSYQVAKYCILDLKRRMHAKGYELMSDEFESTPRLYGRAPPPPAAAADEQVRYVIFDEDAFHRQMRTERQTARPRVPGPSLRTRLGRQLPVNPHQAALEAFFSSAFGDMCRANCVGSTMMTEADGVTPMPINLDFLQYVYREMVTYQEGTFPGACLAPPALAPIKVLVFDTGRLVVTGGRMHSALENAMMHTHAILRTCSLREYEAFRRFYERHNPAVIEDMRRYTAESRRSAESRRQAAANRRTGRRGGVLDGGVPTMDEVCAELEALEVAAVDDGDFYALLDDERAGGIMTIFDEAAAKDGRPVEAAGPMRKRVRRAGE